MHTAPQNSMPTVSIAIISHAEETNMFAIEAWNPHVADTFHAGGRTTSPPPPVSTVIVGIHDSSLHYSTALTALYYCQLSTLLYCTLLTALYCCQLSILHYYNGSPLLLTALYTTLLPALYTTLLTALYTTLLTALYSTLLAGQCLTTVYYCTLLAALYHWQPSTLHYTTGWQCFSTVDIAFVWQWCRDLGDFRHSSTLYCTLQQTF